MFVVLNGPRVFVCFLYNFNKKAVEAIGLRVQATATRRKRPRDMHHLPWILPAKPAEDGQHEETNEVVESGEDHQLQDQPVADDGGEQDYTLDWEELMAGLPATPPKLSPVVLECSNEVWEDVASTPVEGVWCSSVFLPVREA